MDKDLTKDADALICLIYKDYLERRANGEPKSRAKQFGSSEDVCKNLAPKMTPEDTDETCCELGRSGYLTCQYADDIAYEIELSDKGIIYMENRFKEGISSVLDYMGKIKSAIPFL